MSSITSGVGLVSGLPIRDLVDSLILVQRRPISLLQNRLSVLTGRRTALLLAGRGWRALRNRGCQGERERGIGLRRGISGGQL